MTCRLLFSFYLRLLNILWIICLLGNYSSIAQEIEISKRKFTKVANLDGLKVKCILKDKFGFMWFGTEVGLYRYDGYSTQHISNTTEDMYLSSNAVLSLYEDHEANLWIGTDNGINKLSADRRSLKSYLASDSISAPGKNTIQAITQTHDGALWCSSLSGNLYKATNKEHFTFITNVASGTKGPFSPQITHLTEDSLHHIWVADSHRGFQRLDHTGKVLQYFPIPPKQEWTRNYVEKNNLYFADRLHIYTYAAQENKFIPVISVKQTGLFKYDLNYLYQDKRGLFWGVTSDKLVRLNAATKQIDDFTDAFMRTGPDRFTIDCLYEDSSGQLWFGTHYGVYMLENTQNIFTTITPPPPVGNHSIFDIQSFIRSGAGKLLIGSYNGFFEYDSSTNHFEEYKLFKQGFDEQGVHWSKWVNPLVKAFIPDTNGNIWVVTEGNGLLHYNSSSHTFSPLLNIYKPQIQEQAPFFNYSLLKDTDGKLWLGGYDNLYLFDPKTHSVQPYSWGEAERTFSSLKIMALHQTKDKAIWVGTDNGLYKIMKGKGVTAHYTSLPTYNKYNHRSGLSNNFIHCMYEDKNGHLWLGTKGGGINVLNPENGKVEKSYTVKEGLANDVICAILPGKEELWISTDNGLSRFDLKQKSFRNFYAKDGLPGNIFNPGSAMVDADGKLYFGSTDVIVTFNPERLELPAQAPQVILTKLVQHQGTNNTIEETAIAIHTVKDIQLHYKDQFFTVYFAIKDFFDHTNTHRFAYKLEGITNQWQTIGSINYIQFAGLPAGEYTLRIKGMGSNGIWGEELRIPILVGQAFYATRGAYVFYAFVVLAIMGIIFWYRLMRIRLQHQLHLEHMQQEKLQELDQLKTQFFTNITHEFRTPLTLIISPVEQLCSGQVLPPPEILRQQHHVIFRNAKRLLQLINQLLDSAKLEAGSMRVEESRGDVALFVGQLIEPFRLQAEKKGIRLEYIWEDKQAEYLFDAEKLEKIFDNLLSNALKFTPSGGSVQVELTCYPTQEGKFMLSLKVSDTGIGIEASQLPFIFNRFYQINDSRTKALAGSGLGLSLVKELTELLGGEVEVESGLEKGTTFRITLPLRQADSSVTSTPVSALPVIAPEQEVVLPDLPETAKDAPLVLVVEDHEELLDFIAGGLASKYRVITAKNGEEGWQLAQQELPNVVISDVAMPQMDGFTLSELIKSTPLTSHIALILLTARTSAENRVKGLSAGANDYLIKPFNLQELHLRVANWLSYQQTLQKYWLEKFGQANPIELPAPSTGPPMEEDPFLLKVNEVLQRELGNSAFNVEELAQEMAVTTRTLQRKLSSMTGMNAVDLLRTFRLNKAAALLREGYSVSEAAYQVGFEGLSYFSKCFKAQFLVSPSEYALSDTSK